MIRKLGRKFLPTLLAVAMLLGSFTSFAPLASAESQAPTLQLRGSNQVGNPLQLVSTQVLGEGVVTGTFHKVINGSTNVVHVTQVDLNNPYTEIVPLYGKQGKLDERQSVKALAEEKENVVAAVNADFFHMNRIGTPFGIVMDQGKIISSMGYLEGWNSLGITQDRQALIQHFPFSGYVKAANGQTFPLFGVNKEPYGFGTGNSHENTIHLFTPAWGKKTPTVFEPYTNYVTVSIEDNVVVRVEENAPARTFLDKEQILWGQGVGATFLLENVRVGDTLEIGAQNGQDTLGLLTAIGGHALLVENGQARSNIYPDVKGAHPRTAVGISQDGKIVYLVVVEGNQRSKGVSLAELARIMVEVGAYRAANLDGGGSSTLVGRRLGEFEISLFNETKSGTVMRKVPTGLGVLNTAPRGNLASMQILGDQHVFKGDSLSFQLKGYDEHYHPYRLTPEQVAWSVDEQFGSVTNGIFQAVHKGYAPLQATHEGVVATHYVQVLGGEDIRELRFTPTTLEVMSGQSKQLSLQAQLSTGASLILKEANVDEIRVEPSELGVVEGFTFTGQLEGEGNLIVRIDGREFTLPVRVGHHEQSWPIVDYLQGVYHTAHPQSLANKGNFRLTQGDEPVQSGQHALRLAYNFAGAPANDVRIAYGQLNGGVAMPGSPLGLGVWIYGDGSKQWARALVQGANGKEHYVDLAKEIDWTGWRYVQGFFPSELVYPATLRSVYVVNAVEGAASRPEQGVIYFDSFSLLQPNRPEFAAPVAPVPLPKPSNGQEENNPFKDLITHWSKPYVLPLTQQGVIQGISADRFAPDQLITRAQLAVLLDRLFGWSVDEGKRVNVEEGIPAYAQKSVQAVIQQGVMQTFQDGTFRPNEPVSRAQLALYLHRALNTNLTGNVAYQDQAQIPDWAQEPARQLTLLGILQGDEHNRFMPNQQVTRAQVATVLYRLSTQKAAGQNN